MLIYSLQISRGLGPWPAAANGRPTRLKRTREATIFSLSACERLRLCVCAAALLCVFAGSIIAPPVFGEQSPPLTLLLLLDYVANAHTRGALTP
jgi:hypothetical protein